MACVIDAAEAKTIDSFGAAATRASAATKSALWSVSRGSRSYGRAAGAGQCTTFLALSRNSETAEASTSERSDRLLTTITGRSTDSDIAAITAGRAASGRSSTAKFDPPEMLFTRRFSDEFDRSSGRRCARFMEILRWAGT